MHPLLYVKHYQNLPLMIHIQKYNELARVFGPTEVRLLTADTIIGTPLTRCAARRARRRPGSEASGLATYSSALTLCAGRCTRARGLAAFHLRDLVLAFVVHKGSAQPSWQRRGRHLQTWPEYKLGNAPQGWPRKTLQLARSREVAMGMFRGSVGL